jgi:hypothetical protein
MGSISVGLTFLLFAFGASVARLSLAGRLDAGVTRGPGIVWPGERARAGMVVVSSSCFVVLFAEGVVALFRVLGEELEAPDFT